MTPAELRTIGERLYGDGWQSKLAKSLVRDDETHVNVRTVRRWAAGQVDVPPAVAELLRLRAENAKKQPPEEK